MVKKFPALPHIPNDFAKMERRETSVQRREHLPLLTLTLPYHTGVAQHAGGTRHKLPATRYFHSVTAQDTPQYLEPVRKVLVFGVGDFSHCPFFHTNPKKTCFFSMPAFFRSKIPNFWRGLPVIEFFTIFK